MIRNCIIETDINDITNIYNYYIKNSNVTFVEKEISKEEMIKKITDATKDYPWLVYEFEEKIVGYAYARKWGESKAYQHSTEAAIYVDKKYHGKKIGTKLYEKLIEELKQLSVHCLIGGIILPNDPSLKLHEKLGFEKIGDFKEIGIKHSNYLDVSYWQLIL